MRHALYFGAALMISAPVLAIDGETAMPETTAEITAEISAKLEYPDTKTVKVVEDHFGVKVADPYRWLEDDVRTSPDVAQWVEAENAVSKAYLDTLPGRDILAGKMTALYDYERFGIPRKAGKQYFFTKNDGLQNQSVLYVRPGLKGRDRKLIDPNAWAKDGATALDAWEPSSNGKLLAYSIQDGGTDWRIIKVLDVVTGKVLEDEIKWAKFTGINWVGNGGFLYSRFAEPKTGAAFQSVNYNQTVYFHKIGTPQSDDQVVYATPDRPELSHGASVTQDGRWVIITSSRGTDEKYELHAIPMAGQMYAMLDFPVTVVSVDDLEKGAAKRTEPSSPAPTWTGGKPIRLVDGLEHEWNLIDGIGDSLWFVTNKDAPKLKVVRADLFSDTKLRIHQRGLSLGCGPVDDEPCLPTITPPWTFTDIIAERNETLASAQIVGNRVILSYLRDAKSLAIMTDLAGNLVRTISLNNIGTASGFAGKPGDPETFFSFASLNQPTAIYRFDSKTGKTTPFAKPRLSFDPANILVDQVFYPSKDGTEIPMFIVRRKDIDLTKGAPTLLYGYGGFNLSQLPGYDPRRMAWIQSGGVFALANLRGGGEYGKPWHDAGRLMNKQNVFDDFAAAGEYLIAKGISAKGKLAIEGRSNGGLLVGASLNQRPDLFAAGHAAVGVMDMVRFDRFTAGRYWVDDYGNPAREADFKMQMTYSPYHNIKSGVDYPAIIVSTADTDDRVVPGHSFKYTAALQAAEIGDKPHIIRIETRAGHGSGKPTAKLIEEYADIYAFLAKWTGLDLKPE